MKRSGTNTGTSTLTREQAATSKSGLKESPDFSKIRTFKEFYPLYLGEHSNRTNRRLHFIGSTFVLLCLLMLIFTGNMIYLLYAPLFGYGFAWVGHFFFEKNKPATFKRPLWSLMGDWTMYAEIATGSIPF